jgi:hypothetical protein
MDVMPGTRQTSDNFPSILRNPVLAAHPISPVRQKLPEFEGVCSSSSFHARQTHIGLTRDQAVDALITASH